MRCCQSPANAVVHDSDARRSGAREVAAQFEALLFREAFAPLSKAMGFYGDIVAGVVAQAMVRGAGAGLTAPLERVIEGKPRGGGHP
jgi:hypothetical protein